MLVNIGLHRRGFTATVAVLAALSAHVPRAAIADDGPGGSWDVLDPLADLRIDPDDLSGDIRIDALEPPGGEEFLVAVIKEAEAAVDRELDFLQAGGFLPPHTIPSASMRPEGALTSAQRAHGVQVASDGTKKRRKKESDRAARVDSVAKSWRKATRRITDLANEQPTEKDVRKLVTRDYDEAKFGPADTAGLFRLRNSVEARQERLEQLADYFLARVKGSVKDIESVDDWRVVSRSVKEFGKTVNEQHIENVVQEHLLVGVDEAFANVQADAKKHDFEGHFLYSRQKIDGDDTTTTVVLAEGEPMDEHARRARDLLADMAWLREIRNETILDRPLEYADAEITMESLLPDAAGIIPGDSGDEALKALQKHFGAPVGRRTRTKNAKLIEWTGVITGVDENLEARLGIEADAESGPIHVCIVDAADSPLGEEAAFGKLKLGDMVTLVATVAKLEFEDQQAGTLRFTLSPQVKPERTSAEALARSDKKGSTKSKEPRRPVGVFDRDLPPGL